MISVTDSKPLQSLASVLTQWPLGDLSNVKEVAMLETKAKKDAPDNKLYSRGNRKLVIGEEKAVNVRSDNGTLSNLGTEDIKNSAGNENLKASVENNTEARHM